jgi:hypothetical protein
MITVETPKKPVLLWTLAVLFLPMLLIFGCIFMLQQIALASQTATTDSLANHGTIKDEDDDNNFLTYVNSTYGIRLEYPSNWINFTDSSGTITFLPVPENNSGPRYLVGVNVLDLPSYFSSTINIVNFILDSYKKTLNNFELIESTQANLANNSAQKIIYTYTLGSAYNIPVKAMEILTTKYDKAYIVSFATEASQYSSHISIVQKVINSFEIIDTEQVTFPLNGSKDGKQQQKKNFLTYENPNHRIKIQYPSRWQIEEIDRNQYDSIIHVAQFYSPQENFLEIYPESLEISIDTLLSPAEDDNNNKNLTLDKYADEVVKNYTETLPEFKLVELNKNSTLAGNNSAYELIYTAKIVDVSNRIGKFNYKTIEMGTIIGDKVFKVNYYAPQSEFSDFLPIIKKMIDSFEIYNTAPSDEDIEEQMTVRDGRFI